MTAGKKCLKCGLMQMAHTTCKACGNTLSGAALYATPPRSAPQPHRRVTAHPTWLQQHWKPLLLGSIGILLLLTGIYRLRIAGMRKHAAIDLIIQPSTDAALQTVSEVFQALGSLPSIAPGAPPMGTTPATSSTQENVDPQPGD